MKNRLHTLITGFLLLAGTCVAVWILYTGGQPNNLEIREELDRGHYGWVRFKYAIGILDGTRIARALEGRTSEQDLQLLKMLVLNNDERELLWILSTLDGYPARERDLLLSWLRDSRAQQAVLQFEHVSKAGDP